MPNLIIMHFFFDRYYIIHEHNFDDNIINKHYDIYNQY